MYQDMTYTEPFARSSHYHPAYLILRVVWVVLMHKIRIVTRVDNIVLFWKNCFDFHEEFLIVLTLQWGYPALMSGGLLMPMELYLHLWKFWKLSMFLLLSKRRFTQWIHLISFLMWSFLFAKIFHMLVASTKCMCACTHCPCWCLCTPVRKRTHACVRVPGLMHVHMHAGTFA